MANTKPLQKSYFELTEHNNVQVFIFVILLIFSTIIVFILTLPLMEAFFKEFLRGNVYMSQLPDKDPDTDKITLSYFFLWAIDIKITTSETMRYYFNPLISLFLQSGILGLLITVVISTLLPINLGYIKHKIEREIANQLDKISMIKYGLHAEYNQDEIIEEILNADLKELYDYADSWKISHEDLLIIYKALKWKRMQGFYKLRHINDGIRMYMRFHFTQKYSNTVLGFVYMGAAVLIIIIGLRGLKFIPPTQPSLVLFALGLEFSLLIIYAITLMYSKQDEEKEGETILALSQNHYLNSDFGSSKDVERLLRVFIKTSKSGKTVK